MQHALYRAAKADPGRRFHALYDKVYRRDVLQRAWEQVRRNRGAAGIDRTTLAMVERYGVDRLLGELAADLKDGSYRPLPARQVVIPKSGGTGQRPLSIPAVRDRVVQTAAKVALEPIFEAGFAPRGAAFLPGEVGDLAGSLSQQGLGSWGQPDPGGAGEGGSSPDNVAEAQYCQMRWPR